VLRCQGGDTDAHITWHESLGSEAVVKSRVGSAEVRVAPWSLSTDKEESFYPDGLPGPHGKNAEEFIVALISADRFVAQATPHDESPVTAVFDVRGLGNAARPLLDACGWGIDEERESVAEEEPSFERGRAPTTQERLDELIGRNEGVRDCFELSKTDDQSPAEPVRLSFVLRADGSLTSVNFHSAAIQESAFGACLVRVLETLKLDGYDGEPWLGNYTLDRPGQ